MEAQTSTLTTSALATASDGLCNSTIGFVKRLFLSPKRLFKSISEAAEEFEGSGLPLPDEEFKPENDMGG